MVTEEIANKILSAVAEMGYRPNTFAQSLKTNRSYTIGVMVPDLTNPAFALIIKGIDNLLESHGYSVIVANTYNLEDKQQSTLNKFRERHVDGLIIATAKRKEALISDCIGEGTPFVQAVRTSETTGVCSVVSDELIGGNMVISHLAQLGHKRIAYIAGPQFFSTGFERYRGFLGGMLDNSLQVENESVILRGFILEEMHKDLVDSDQALAIERFLDYENYFTELLVEKGDVINAMAYAIFEKYDINQYQGDLFKRKNKPNPIFYNELKNLLKHFIWNWQEYLDKNKIVFSEKTV